MDLGLGGKIAIVTGGSKGIGRATALRQRLDPGIDSADFDRQVMALQERVEVVGQRTRGSFAPRITVRTRSGDEFSDELHGNELEWDFATETVRIGELFPQMDWPTEKLAALAAPPSWTRWSPPPPASRARRTWPGSSAAACRGSENGQFRQMSDTRA